MAEGGNTVLIIQLGAEDLYCFILRFLRLRHHICQSDRSEEFKRTMVFSALSEYN